MRKFLVTGMGFEGTPPTGTILVKTDQSMCHRQLVTDQTTTHVLRHML